MNTKIREAIKVIECFAVENRCYWIFNFKGLTDSEKGFLLVHFNL